MNPLLTDLIQNQAGERESNKENTGVERSFVRRHWSHGLEEKRTLWSIKSTRNQENLRGGGLVNVCLHTNIQASTYFRMVRDP